MTKIAINKDKCVKCGLCAKDCVAGCIELIDEGFPITTDEKRCISCQHCLAICPTGALAFGEKLPENSQAVNNDNLLNIIKSRRSIRHYKQEEISEELLTKIKEMLPHIPTGCNSHALHFTIVKKKSVMEELRKRVNALLIKSMSYNLIAPLTNKFSKYKDALLSGEDVIFRNAPHMIVVSSPVTAPCADIDPIIALSYIELYAQSLGLGTCWCGFAEICIKVFPTISEILQIPEGYTPIYTMLLGYPDVKYTRTPQPEPYKISEITEVTLPTTNFLAKAKRFLTNFLR